LRYAFEWAALRNDGAGTNARRSWRKTPLLMAKMQHREDQVFLVLAFVIGALTGL